MHLGEGLHVSQLNFCY